MKVINKLESYPTGDMLVPYCPNCDNPTYSERKCPFCNTELEYEEMIEKDKEIERLHSIIKEVRELAIIKKARVENEPDYSKSYLEGYENAIQSQHLSHSGVMLETIKSTIKTTCNDFLEILEKENI